MSRVYFHTKESEAKIHGSERHYMAFLVNNLTYGFLETMTRTWGKAEPEILQNLPDEHYLRDCAHSEHFSERFKIYLVVGMSGDSLVFHDKEISPFTLCLNTAMIAGSDPIRLCARIYGQGEIHCYVMPENFEWFAHIIEQGRKLNIFRSDVGWESVLDLIKRTKDSPIVLSYSVCDGFPNSYVADWKDDHDGDDWYDLPRNQRWDLAMKGLLKQNETSCLEMTPGYWEDFHFGNGLTAFDFLNDSSKK